MRFLEPVRAFVRLVICTLFDAPASAPAVLRVHCRGRRIATRTLFTRELGGR